jgi:hypothetical protein
MTSRAKVSGKLNQIPIRDECPCVFQELQRLLMMEPDTGAPQYFQGSQVDILELGLR